MNGWVLRVPEQGFGTVRRASKKTVPSWHDLSSVSRRPESLLWSDFPAARTCCRPNRLALARSWASRLSWKTCWRSSLVLSRQACNQAMYRPSNEGRRHESTAALHPSGQRSAQLISRTALAAGSTRIPLRRPLGRRVPHRECRCATLLATNCQLPPGEHSSKPSLLFKGLECRLLIRV